MADAAALRREARRRKILENSHNRLQLITGKAQDPTELTISSSTSPDLPDYEEDEIDTLPTGRGYDPSFIPNGALFNESDILGFIQSNHINQSSGDNLLNEIAHALPSAESVKTATLWERLVATKYDIVLVSIAMQMLFILTSMPAEMTYFFFPIVIYIVTKLILFPTNPHSKLGSLLMLIDSMPQVRVKKLILVVKYVLAFLEDIGIYLFCTICLQALWVTLFGAA